MTKFEQDLNGLIISSYNKLLPEAHDTRDKLVVEMNDLIRRLELAESEIERRKSDVFVNYPPGMGEESRRLHREYNALVEAQLNGAKNGAEVVRLTDECAAKGIILVPGGENL